MSVATWPGTPYGPIIQIGYPAELGDEYRWDTAAWAGPPPSVRSGATPDLMEPFDDYTTNGWDTMGHAGSTIEAGRTDTAAQVVAGLNQGPTWTIPGPAVSDWVTVGFAWRWTDPSGNNPRTVIQFRHSTSPSFQHWYLRAQPAAGTFTAENYVFASTLGTSAGGLYVKDQWVYVEVRTKCHGSTGSVQVRVNEVTVINVTNVNTYSSVGTAAYDTIRLCNDVSATYNQWDDLYLTTGSTATFQGDIEIGGEPPPDLPDGRWGPWWDWRNVECDVQTASIVRGTASPSQRASSSTVSITIRPHDNTLAPWWVDPVTGEHPNRGNLPFRVGVQNLLFDQEWWLFTGWVDYITEVDSTDEVSLTVVASDGLKHLALLNQAEQAAQGSGEAAGSRIGRVLDHAAWQAGRELSPGTFALQATTLAQPALEEIYLTADTEGGLVWVDVNGAFRFVDRDWLRARSERTDWHIGDGTVDVNAVCASSIVTTADDMDVQNVIGISRVGGTAAWTEDPASIAKYGRHSWSRTDLPYADDADTPTILAFQLADRAAHDYHAQAVVLSPLSEAEAWQVCVAVELYDTVHLTRSRGEDVRAELGGVIGIDHTFGPGEFVTVLSLGPRIRQTLDRWDQARWDQARWSAT